MQISKYLKLKIRSFKTFDWILVILSFLVLLVFAVIFFRKSTYINATISVGDESAFYGSLYNRGPKIWFANAFRKGQTEKDGVGRIQAEILDVYSYNIVPEHKTVYLNVRLNCIFNRATNTYTFKGVPVLVGSTLKLNLDKVYAEGLVTEVQGFPSHSERRTIRIEAQIREDNPTFPGTSGTKSYLADAIKIGDKVEDNNGNLMISVIDKRILPAEITIGTSDGRAINAKDPAKKDVFLILDVQADKVNDKYYFLNSIPILIDQSIPLNTTTVSIFPTVTKFLTY